MRPRRTSDEELVDLGEQILHYAERHFGTLQSKDEALKLLEIVERVARIRITSRWATLQRNAARDRKACQ